MQFKREAKILTSMEPLALTDIIINMFIFFFITFSFLATFQKTREGQVDVSLPKAASAKPPVEKKRLSVSLKKDGQLFLGETPTTIEELEARFKAEKSQGADVTLVIRADGDVTHNRVVQVMDLARNRRAGTLGDCNAESGRGLGIRGWGLGEEKSGLNPSSRPHSDMSPWQERNLAAITHRLAPLRYCPQGVLFERQSAYNHIVVRRKRNQFLLCYRHRQSHIEEVQSRLDPLSPLGPSFPLTPRLCCWPWCGVLSPGVFFLSAWGVGGCKWSCTMFLKAPNWRPLNLIPL